MKTKKSPEFTIELADEDIVLINGKTPAQIRSEQKRKDKRKRHHCPVMEFITPCGRQYTKVKSTPLPDCRSVTCKSCVTRILKARKRKY